MILGRNKYGYLKGSLIVEIECTEFFKLCQLKAITLISQFQIFSEGLETDFQDLKCCKTGSAVLQVALMIF